MRLKEAFFKLKIGEKFKMVCGEVIKKNGERDFLWTDGEKLTLQQLITYEFNVGEIMPAEPVVFNVDQMWDWFWPEQKGDITKSDFERLLNKCRKNYRLERDKELRPVIEEIKKILEASIPLWIDKRISGILQNIPPLNKDE